MILHILGIGGTFMSGLAVLARELGFTIEGSDQKLYPPMSTQLENLNISLKEGYCAEHLQPAPTLTIVGNALSRGNPAVEYLLDQRLPYRSGPQWLGETVLANRTVVAVAGTHGKTTTTSLLAWLLQSQQLNPGFLVGGMPENFGISARLGAKTAPFVIEADEYDTAFFDKRSKFLHYQPTIAILNNLEYDHADIFPDISAIQRQFHHLVRLLPRNGKLIVNAEDGSLKEVLAMGCWTPVDTFGLTEGNWQARLIKPDGSEFAVLQQGQPVGTIHWPLTGKHNVMNALAALAASSALGVDIQALLPHFSEFRSVKRRLEVIAMVNHITIYDDFAHHPTAIATTLAGLRAKIGSARILVGIEPRSNSMRLGTHADQLAPSFNGADHVVLLSHSELNWDTAKMTNLVQGRCSVVPTVETLLKELTERAKPGDHVVFMSNGGFENAPRRFAKLLEFPVRSL